MSATMTAKDVLKDVLTDEAVRFGKLYAALKECTPATQEIVSAMAQIIASEEADEDDRSHAADVILEALFPMMMHDFVEHDGDFLRGSKRAIEAKAKMDAEEQTFSDRLRALMSQKDISEKRLAELTGVGQPAISNMLNRRCRPQRRTIARFAEVFGVNPEELWPTE